MNQRFTYSIPTRTLSFPATASHICVSEPPPAHMSLPTKADQIFVSEPRPTSLNHPVQPLKGLRDPRAASVSYRALAPDGANQPFGIERKLFKTPIRYSSFYILHSSLSYTFSTKERDPETGLSYFGSRYYSSDLSVWLSVDPMSDKYASTSPYAYCRNNPIRLVDPNGMFDDEAKATRVRNRAARRYGEDRVSDVFNNTIGEGKAHYSFRIYGKGKTWYSRGGGTKDGGPVITCDKADKVVSSGKDFRAYKKSSKGSLNISLTLTAGAQYGTKIDRKGRGIGLMGNIASVDLAAVSLEINRDGISTDNYLINQTDIQGNSGFTVGPIGYNYYSETALERTIYSNHSVSAFGFNIYNSDLRGNEVSYSFSAAAILGVRFNLKVKY